MLFIAAGVLMYSAKQEQAKADALQSLINAQQRQDAKIVRVILTSGDCNSKPDLTGEFWSGKTAAAYCANPNGNFHPRLESVCFDEGVRQYNNAMGHYDAPRLKEHYVELACGIAESYPDTTEDWQDPALNDSLESLIGVFLKRN